MKARDGILHSCLTTIGPPKSGVAQVSTKAGGLERGNSYSVTMTWRTATGSLCVDAGCIIRRMGRRMSYTRDDAGVMTRLTAKLLDQVRGRLRLRHYSLRTEQAYVGWIRRFVLANGQRLTASSTDGEGRGRSVSHRTGHAGTGVGRHAESGAGGTAVPVSRGSGSGVALDGEFGARQAAAAHSSAVAVRRRD
ncbi:hypothetical protein GGR63_002892 [Xanthomonas sp. 3272]|nr:hypothetical protein [Xanthomonas arboricola]